MPTLFTGLNLSYIKMSDQREASTNGEEPLPENHHNQPAPSANVPQGSAGPPSPPFGPTLGPALGRAPRRRPFLNAQTRNQITTGNYEGLFMHYLFVSMTMRYARYFKPKIRRLIEFFALLNAFLMFGLLVYIHVSFVRSENYCLEAVEGIWPRSGILRVQILRGGNNLPKHKLYFSTAPFVPTSTTLYEHNVDGLLEIKQTIPASFKDVFEIFSVNQKRQGVAVIAENCTFFDKELHAYWSLYLLKDMSPVRGSGFDVYIEKRIKETLRNITYEMNHKPLTEEFEDLNKELVKYEATVGKLTADVTDVRDFYAIEFSTEFGYLRLTTDARRRLAIPTLVVNLQAENEKCFGSDFKQMMLRNFLGYDDFIMTSIKKLAEKSKNQGYLRNLVTGEYFRFESVWNNQVSSIIAFVTMSIFTVVVTLLLRYSYHQIFIAMVEIVRMVDNAQRVFLPIGPGPMFTIILALVGMEEIMLEFFHDSSIAFYVIIIIWVADQFDLVCMNSIISRRYWIRFFFLYHFAFYAYHHRYNGRFSKLALLTSWLFIQHSMVYFLHHYELPLIQRQLDFFGTQGGGVGGVGGGNHNQQQAPQANEADDTTATPNDSSTSSPPHTSSESDSRSADSSASARTSTEDEEDGTNNDASTATDAAYDAVDINHFVSKLWRLVPVWCRRRVTAARISVKPFLASLSRHYCACVFLLLVLVLHLVSCAMTSSNLHHYGVTRMRDQSVQLL